VAKRRTGPSASDGPENQADKPQAEAQGDREQDPGPSAVDDAKDAIRRAEEELRRARQWYEQLRQKATERIKEVRESGLGDITCGTLKLVRKYPGPSVIIAMVLGFFLGRLFRR
jgi:ElaB/YqjD/DUF883 family membrane-anchored ribosome-binding protein